MIIGKNTFQRSKEYPYKPSSLKLLSEKTSLFLLNYFQEIYKNQEKGTLHKKRKKVEYKLVTLGKTVDSRCLPTGYNTCDHCNKKLNNGEVLMVGHGYHYECYQILEYGYRYHYCEEYYKRGIYSNVKSFLERLEKGSNILTPEESKGEEYQQTPSQDTCDHCNKKLNNGEVLMVGHGYHYECYQILEYGYRYHYCEEYYKRGIYSNVKSFLERLEKGSNILTPEESKGEEVLVEENKVIEEVEMNRSQEVHNKLLKALNCINT
ncbi:hypothetical protein Glove_482g48 [Diversispora epigaea]|uniref:Uncharacterized protein n=1 Tax=Diversispora epigaea TaxID=1348612 RepID=A0A397GQ58_9GLOM|nr:hypothetical protein Glove_482g48 [Diversispora epigaea]